MTIRGASRRDVPRRVTRGGTLYQSSFGVTASRSVSGILYRRPLRVAGGDHPSVRSTRGCLAAGEPPVPSVRSCFECRATDRRRRRPWCALTAPFHPCLIATGVAPSAVCSLLHGMSGSPDLARASTLLCEVPTFLNRALGAQLRSPDRLAVTLKATGRRLRNRPGRSWRRAPRTRRTRGLDTPSAARSHDTTETATVMPRRGTTALLVACGGGRQGSPPRRRWQLRR